MNNNNLIFVFHNNFNFKRVLKRNDVFFVKFKYCDKFVQFNKKKKIYFIVVKMSFRFKIDIIIIIDENKYY